LRGTHHTHVQRGVNGMRSLRRGPAAACDSDRGSQKFQTGNATETWAPRRSRCAAHPASEKCSLSARFGGAGPHRPTLACPLLRGPQGSRLPRWRIAAPDGATSSSRGRCWFLSSPQILASLPCIAYLSLSSGALCALPLRLTQP
jgi:hypothetical protein